MKKTTYLTRPIICKIDTSFCHQDFMDSFNAQQTLIKETINLVFPFIVKYPEIITAFGVRDALHYGKSKHNISASELQDLATSYTKLCDSYNISKKRTVRRDICTVVGDMFLAIKKRFKKQNITNTPKIKSNKCIRSNEGLYKVHAKNGQYYLSLEILEGVKLECPIEICNKNMTQYVGRDFKVADDTYISKTRYGGIIYSKKKQFVAKLVTKIKFEEQYVPKDVLGLDINKREEAYLALSDGRLIARPKNISKLSRKLLDLNQDIKNAVSTKERCLKRKMWRNKQKEIKTSVLPLVSDIIKEATEKEWLLCIDGAKPGAKNGEYGQILTSVLRNECERLNMPHVWVDSYYTSTTCVKCGHRHKKNRKSESEFECVSCGHQDDADIHSAQYIAKIGKQTYDS